MSNLLQSIPEGRIVCFPSFHTPTLQTDTAPKLPGLRGPKARRHHITNSPHQKRRASYSLPYSTSKNLGLIYYSFFRKKVISFIAGFALQDIRVTFGLFGAATVLLSLVRVFPSFLSLALVKRALGLIC